MPSLSQYLTPSEETKVGSKPNKYVFASGFDELQERMAKTIDIGHTVLQYGWIPFIIYVGYTRSNPQPSLIKLLSPLA